MLIVPICFSLDDYDFVNKMHLRPFYAFLYFAYQNKMPIICQEEYTVDPNTYLKNDNTKDRFTDESLKQWNIKMMTTKEFSSVKKYVISNEESDEVCQPYSSRSEAFINILKRKNQRLEKILLSKINKIEETEQRKIDAFLVWVCNPTITAIAKQRNIKIIQMELSPIRKPYYIETFGYCTNRDKFDNQIISKEYELFKKSVPKKDMLSKDEILALLLPKEDAALLKEKQKKPKYKVGVALSLPGEYFLKVYSNYNNEQMLDAVRNLVDDQSISVRCHPGSSYQLSGIEFDQSPTSREWVLKCQTLVSGVSNVLFEALLYDRHCICTSPVMPWSFVCQDHFEYLDTSNVELEFINFLLFFYFAPFKKMFTMDYLKKKFFSDITIYDLYKYNRDYLLSLHHLDSKIFNLSFKERQEKIISTCFSKDFYEEYVHYNYESILEKDLINIYNSKSYRFIDKLRHILKK